MTLVRSDFGDTLTAPGTARQLPRVCSLTKACKAAVARSRPAVAAYPTEAQALGCGYNGVMEERLRALTVKAPYAQLIARGVKTIETRPWAPQWRGELVIHTAQRAYPDVENLWKRLAREGDDPTTVPYGHIVCVVDLVDVIRVEDCPTTSRQRLYGDFTPGRFGWVLRNPRIVTPIPARGQQGFWTVDPNHARSLRNARTHRV